MSGYEDVLLQKNKAIFRDAILITYRGSVSHNLYVPSDQEGIDDIDILGVVVPGRSHYFGLKQFGSHGTVEIKHEQWDMVFYEARKMVSMLAQANPNVLSMLWLEQEHYLLLTALGGLLIENRHLFMTRRIYHTFRGYAYAQLAKMQKSEFAGYMGVRRKLLVEQFGYDTKNASHLIRLLIMGNEALRTGELEVYRTGKIRDLLLDIKRGEYSLEEVKKMADGYFESLIDAKQLTSLPEEPDMDAINDLCVHIVESTM